METKKGDSSMKNALKLICNITNQDFVNINAYTKFGVILTFCSQDIEGKQNYDRQTIRQNLSNSSRWSSNDHLAHFQNLALFWATMSSL